MQQKELSPKFSNRLKALLHKKSFIYLEYIYSIEDNSMNCKSIILLNQIILNWVIGYVCLTVIFPSYRAGQFYWRRIPEHAWKNPRSAVTNKLDHKTLYRRQTNRRIYWIMAEVCSVITNHLRTIPLSKLSSLGTDASCRCTSKRLAVS